jgi:hypothetical protein
MLDVDRTSSVTFAPPIPFGSKARGAVSNGGGHYDKKPPAASSVSPAAAAAAAPVSSSWTPTQRTVDLEAALLRAELAAQVQRKQEQRLDAVISQHDLPLASAATDRSGGTSEVWTCHAVQQDVWT